MMNKFVMFSMYIFDFLAILKTLRWRRNGHDVISNHQPHYCLLNNLFRCRSQKTSKLRVTGLCARNSPGTGEFPTQMASNAENVSIWWRHHDVHSSKHTGQKIFAVYKCVQFWYLSHCLLGFIYQPLAKGLLWRANDMNLRWCKETQLQSNITVSMGYAIKYHLLLLKFSISYM